MDWVCVIGGLGQGIVSRFSLELPLLSRSYRFYFVHPKVRRIHFLNVRLPLGFYPYYELSLEL
jgi:hypothetical protein